MQSRVQAGGVLPKNKLVLTPEMGLTQAGMDQHRHRSIPGSGTT